MERHLRGLGLLLSGCGIVALTACSPSVPIESAAALPNTSTEVTNTSSDNASTSNTATSNTTTSSSNGSTNPIGGSTTLQVSAPARSVTSAEVTLLTTGEDPKPDAAKFPFGHLPQPDLVRLLPQGLPQVGPDAALHLIATPTAKLTAGYANPSDSGPVMALNEDTDMLLNMPAHWAVVGQQEGWVQILTPVGRGAKASVDPSQVNHHTLWVHAKDVTVAPAEYTIEVSTEDYSMTVTGPKGSNTFHIGVGKVGKTETPKGLCAIVGKIMIQSGEPGYLTNCQSEMLDYFDGAADAATAIHEYHELGFDPAVGGAVSNGCMRIPDDAFEKYLSDIPAGTPVIIS